MQNSGESFPEVAKSPPLPEQDGLSVDRTVMRSEIHVNPSMEEKDTLPPPLFAICLSRWMVANARLALAG